MRAATGVINEGVPQSTVKVARRYALIKDKVEAEPCDALSPA